MKHLRLVMLLLAGSSGGVAAADPPAPQTQTVVVQGQRLTVETRIDRKVYTLPDDAQSIVGTLSDVLAEVPSIDVDPDGIVSLRGDSNVLILIDGKPVAQLKGAGAGDSLQSISARDIERIEVLTTPPAQFKAEGAAGVINIITRKHQTDQSAYGSLQASLGDGGRWLIGGSGSYGSKDLTAAVNAGFREDYRSRLLESRTVAQNPASGTELASQDRSSQHMRRNIPNAGFSADYSLSARDTLSSSGTWLSRGGLRTYTQYDESGPAGSPVTTLTRRLTAGRDPEDSYDAHLRHSHKLAKPGELLELWAHRSISHQYEHYDYESDALLPAGPATFDNLSFTEDLGVSEGGVDYSLPLARQSLKVGYAFEEDDYAFNNVWRNFDPVTGVQSIDPLRSDDFQYRQRIHALYASDQASVGSWVWLAGLRSEWTTTDARLLTTGASTPGRYVALYPSLHVDRALSERGTVSLGASRRITRPDAGYLNPYVDREYPPIYNAGNPHLRPQFTQSYEIGYGHEARASSYSATGYYRRSTNAFTDVTSYLGGGLSLTTKANLPRSDSAGLEFAANGHLLPKLSYSLSGNAFYKQFDATALGSPGLKSTTGVNLKAKLDFRPTAADSAQIALVRTDKRLTAQGRISAYHVVNLGMKHALTPALAGVLTVSDLFNGQRYERIILTPALSQDYVRQTFGRILYVGLVYTAGVKTKSEKGESFDYDSGG